MELFSFILVLMKSAEPGDIKW